MKNESVQNFLFGDVSAASRQSEQAKAARKAGDGALTFGEAISSAIMADLDAKTGKARDFAAERKAAAQSEYTVNTANGQEVPSEGGNTADADSAPAIAGANTPEERQKQVNSMMAQALVKVAELLNLPEGAMFDPEQPFEFDPETIEQFADVMAAIEMAVELLDKVVTHRDSGIIERMADMGVYPFSEMRDAGELAGLTADLRTAKFHLDLGFHALGIHEFMMATISERHETHAAAVTGLTQAANPGDLGMSTHDLARAFGSLITENLTSAMERVRQITSGQAEMTELEKAAVEMGTVNSEILKMALGKGVSLEKFAFESVKVEGSVKAGISVDNDVDSGTGVKVNTGSGANVKTVADDAGINRGAGAKIIANTGNDARVSVNASINADTKAGVNTSVNTNIVTNADAGINTNANPPPAPVKVTAETFAMNRIFGDDFTLPLSAGESAGQKKLAGIEAANRRAFESVGAVSMKITAADDTVEIPISAAESTNKKPVNNNAVINNTDNADLANIKHAVKNVHTADKTVEIPVSAAESTSKKSVNNSLVNNNTANNNADNTEQANIKHTAKNVHTADKAVEIPVSAMESTNKKSVNNNIMNNGTDNAAPANVKHTAKNANTAEKAVEIPVSVSESVNSTNKRSASGNVNTTGAKTAMAKVAAADGSLEVPANALNSGGQKFSGSGGNSGAKDGKDSKDNNDNNGVVFAGVNNDSVNTETSADADDAQTGAGLAEMAGFKDSVLDRVEKAQTAFSRVDNEALIRQLTEKMQTAIRNGVHEVRMILRPETLGEVRMSIRVEGDVVMARMQVESRQVKAIVESNMQSLKDDLAKHNLNLAGFSVDVGTDSDRSPRQAWQEMAEANGLRKFRPDGEQADDSADANENDPQAVAAGSDTGRRFGSNTFEYFI